LDVELEMVGSYNVYSTFYPFSMTSYVNIGKSRERGASMTCISGIVSCKAFNANVGVNNEVLIPSRRKGGLYNHNWGLSLYSN